MANIVIMPKLGQATEESTIVKWRKKEGETVKKGDILFEMETDKAVLEAESFFEGTLLKVLVPEGVTVPVNAPVAFIGAPGEPLPEPPPITAPKPEGREEPKPASPKQQPLSTQPAAPAASDTGLPTAVPRPTGQKPPPAPTRKAVSPRARALARACVIDASRIPGTGPGGRVTESDVAAYLAAKGYDRMRISPAAKKLAALNNLDILDIRGTGEGGRIMVHDVERAMKEKPRPMSRMRQVIARRLTESFTTIPHFYVTVSADMTDLMAYRKQLKEQGRSYTVTDFVLEAVVLSLIEFPAVNSVTDGINIRWRGSVDLGVAVALEEGLVVPVIRSADSLSMPELRDAAKALAEKARSGRLLPDDMTGSSFTVSNMGMLNVENFHAIINPGEGAILAVSSTMETPVAREGKIVVRAMMKMTLSADHRIVDGATGAAFVNAVKSKLEDIELWKTLT